MRSALPEAGQVVEKEGLLPGVNTHGTKPGFFGIKVLFPGKKFEIDENSLVYATI